MRKIKSGLCFFCNVIEYARLTWKIENLQVGIVSFGTESEERIVIRPARIKKRRTMQRCRDASVEMYQGRQLHPILNSRPTRRSAADGK